MKLRPRFDLIGVLLGGFAIWYLLRIPRGPLRKDLVEPVILLPMAVGLVAIVAAQLSFHVASGEDFIRMARFDRPKFDNLLASLRTDRRLRIRLAMPVFMLSWTATNVFQGYTLLILPIIGIAVL